MHNWTSSKCLSTERTGYFKDSLTTASLTGIHVTTSRARTQVTRRRTGNGRNPRAGLVEVAAALGRIVPESFSFSSWSVFLIRVPRLPVRWTPDAGRRRRSGGRSSLSVERERSERRDSESPATVGE